MTWHSIYLSIDNAIDPAPTAATPLSDRLTLFMKTSSSRINLIIALLTTCITASYAGGEAARPAGFDKTLKMHGITFQVTCKPCDSSLNQLTITPSGLEIDNSTIEQEIDGSVTGAEIADLNADGSPEIYVYINTAGSGSYASLVAYSANNNKSLSGIYLPPLEDDKNNSRGYMGHDEFTIVGNMLVRRFPVYQEGDTNANPTGGTRELRYELVPGEATWLLKLEKSISNN
jgi:hypothetical protein